MVKIMRESAVSNGGGDGGGGGGGGGGDRGEASGDYWSVDDGVVVLVEDYDVVGF